MAKGWTRKQLAQRLRYRSTSTIRRYETDNVRNHQEEVLIRMAEAFGVPAVWLIDGQGPLPSLLEEA